MTTKRTFLNYRANSPAADEIDWSRVYEDYVSRVYNFFLYRVNDSFQAEDLTATTFTRAWKSRHRYRDDLGSLSTWLFTIARRVAAEHFRRAKHDIPLEISHEVLPEQSVEDSVNHRLDVVRLNRLLLELPPREQELVALKYGAGLTNRDIARLTGLGESNVSTILHRLVQTLRKQWEN